MRKTIQVILSSIGLLIFAFVAYIFYLDQIGPTLVGPKPEIDAICQPLQPGMTTAEIGESRRATLNDLAISSAHGPDMSQISQTRLQVDIQHKNGFVCICQIDVADGVTTSPGEVFCSD